MSRRPLEILSLVESVYEGSQSRRVRWLGASTNDVRVAGFIWAAMSHEHTAIVDRPVQTARSAPARALSPSAERYAPVVRIAVLRAVVFGARMARNVFGIELRGRNPRQLIYFDSVIVSATCTASGRLLPGEWPRRRAEDAPDGRRSRCRPSAPTTVGGTDASTAPRRAPHRVDRRLP